ncbi:MAG: aspartate/glutamate racemase family protein [Desulfohalobiaceae bacterium]|nr:aspartate/glutamate racemase family protein [Desulfohalobiaceae bacterium]
MKFQATPGQTSYGEDIGILLLDSRAPFIRGDVGNAKSYAYPVRFKRVDGLSVERIFAHDPSFLEKMIQGARELVQEGVRAVTGDCGFMALYQQEVKERVDVPVLLSSLTQIPFIRATLPRCAKVGILTANSDSLTAELFSGLGLGLDQSLVVCGLQDKPGFYEAAIAETGSLDSDRIRQEVREAALEMIRTDPGIRSILLECSMLPPYGAAVQEATGLPVYDFLTMINLVRSALVKEEFPDKI